MKRWFRLVPITCSVLIFGAAPSADGPRCSKGSISGVRSSQVSYFIGHALADTLIAGPGSVKYEVRLGHFGPGRDRSIYGQRIRIERFGGAGSARLQPDSVVLVVPWDYGADCQPTPWSATAQFIPVGHRGFYNVTLRDSTLWSGDVPTFDTDHPLFVPYPSPRDRWHQRADDALTADELFDVYALVPTFEGLRDSAWAAAIQFVLWMQSNPSRQLAYPVDDMARSIARSAEAARARLMNVSVAGTYRVTVEISGAASDTFFIRTAAQAGGAWYGPDRYRIGTQPPRWDRHAVGYELYFWHAETLAGLPGDSTSAVRSQRGEWPLSIAEEAISERGVTVWLGHFEFPQLERSLPQNRMMGDLIDDWRNEFRRQWRAGAVAGDELRFRRTLNGVVTFMGEYRLDDTRRIRVAGERISEAVVVGRRW